MGCGCNKRKISINKNSNISNNKCGICGWPLSRVNKWDGSRKTKQIVIRCSNKNCKSRKK